MKSINQSELSELMKPDTYLMYETRPNALSNTNIRFVLELNENINGDILREAAKEAIKRYPYFSVRITVENGSYMLVPNDLPIVVMETTIPAKPLGSKEVNYHLNYIDYKDDTIFFNISHSITDASGYIPFIKSVLYQYIIRIHDESISPNGINLPDAEYLPGEFAYPKADCLPESDYSFYKHNETGYFPFDDYLQAIKNSDVNNEGYYCISMKQRELMKYVHSNDASPAAIISVFMFKTLASIFADEEVFSAGIACNYRNAVSCNNSYHWLSNALHVTYKRRYLDMSVDKLGTITRGMVMLQSQPENLVLYAKQVLDFHGKVNALKTLEEKKAYCLKEGQLTKGCKDTYNVSYVGQTDFGDMNKYVRSMNTVAYGNLLLEINAIGNMFYITFNQVLKTDKYIKVFLRMLDEAELSYSVSNYRLKNVPTIEFPDNY